MAPPIFTLPHVAAIYSVPEEDLLAYEAEGLISPLQAAEQRYYTSKDRLRIEIILKGKKLGFSLREIKQLIEAHLPRPKTPVVGKEYAERQIVQLEDEKAVLQAAIDRLRAKVRDDPG